MVSTIIPVYNRSGLLQDAVASVLAQSHRPIEILIVNDGSTDDTKTVAENLASKHPEYIQVWHQYNSGPGVARQHGLNRARGEFIQFLDSDDLLLPSKFERQIDLLQQHPDCQVCYGISHQQDCCGASATHLEPLKGTGEHHHFLFPMLLVDRWWSTHTPLYRHAALTGIGPWKPWINEEDWEYEARLAATGARLVWLPERVSITRRHSQEEHLSHEGSSDPRKLRDRALARISIYSSAREAGLSHDLMEMRHFARSVFLLSRQCSEAQLFAEAQRLYDLAWNASSGDARLRNDLKIYRILVAGLGWQRAAKLSQFLYHMRPPRRHGDVSL